MLSKIKEVGKIVYIGGAYLTVGAILIVIMIFVAIGKTVEWMCDLFET